MERFQCALMPTTTGLLHIHVDSCTIFVFFFFLRYYLERYICLHKSCSWMDYKIYLRFGI